MVAVEQALPRDAGQRRRARELQRDAQPLASLVGARTRVPVQLTDLTLEQCLEQLAPEVLRLLLPDRLEAEPSARLPRHPQNEELDLVVAERQAERAFARSHRRPRGHDVVPARRTLEPKLQFVVSEQWTRRRPCVARIAGAGPGWRPASGSANRTPPERRTPVEPAAGSARENRSAPGREDGDEALARRVAAADVAVASRLAGADAPGPVRAVDVAEQPELPATRRRSADVVEPPSRA